MNPISSISGYFFPAVALLAVMMFVSGCASYGFQQGPQIPIPLHFVSDRRVQNTGSDDVALSIERGETRYGTVTVKLDADDYTPSVISDVSRWQHLPLAILLDDANLRITLNDSFSIEPERYYGLTDAQEKTVLVYIHGYGREFSEVAEHMAVLIYQMNFKGVPILYSWPSHGRPSAYVADMANADWSALHLQYFLTQLHLDPDIDTVHVVAHSMGNRVLFNALERMSAEPDYLQNWKDGELVLMAPDVDESVFKRDTLPMLARIPNRITLYVSEDDVPLKASSILNDATRLGDASQQIPIYSGIDTIDTSEVLTLFSAHSSYRKNTHVQTDLHYLINKRQGPEQRPGLIGKDAEIGKYWQLQSVD